MGYIRETKLKKGGVRYQAEVRLKGHPTLTAMFYMKINAELTSKRMKIMNSSIFAAFF